MADKVYDFGEIRAIIGLGNFGGKYEKTRHNIGFRVVDRFAEQYGASWTESELMEHAVVMCGGEIVRSIHLIKPLTYMNSSGRVMPFLVKKGIKPEEILVVHDELEKPFGKIAIRWNGSPRGHNGLRSIGGMIGKEFWRLRFGIGRPEMKSQVGNYVLSKFLPEEEEKISLLIEEAVALIDG